MRFLNIVIFTLFLNVSFVLAQDQTQTGIQNASDHLQDFDSLGGNQALLDKVKALNPETSVYAIQNRMVARESRFEVSPELSATLSGQSYFNSQALGISGYYHISPLWSVNIKALFFVNQLTPEGRSVVDTAFLDFNKNPEDSGALYPEINFPKSLLAAGFQWYPLYGKVSWLGRSITQFDLFTDLGFGQMTLKTNVAQETHAGLGIGLWWSPKLSTRAQVYWQGYQAQYLSKTEDINNTSLSLQMGWLL